MSQIIQLKASDGHLFETYEARPSGTPKAGLVILQEVFGLNEHIRQVCEQYAREGYLSIAPALYDRLKKNALFDYTPEGFEEARKWRMRSGWDKPLLDIKAAMQHTRDAGKTAVLGYCWGGSLAWLTTARLKPDCAVAYYGGQIIDFIEEKPRVPILLHFGANDPHIPSTDVAKIEERHKELPVYVYPAGHGFNCDLRGDYHEESARLAKKRTLDFFKTHLS